MVFEDHDGCWWIAVVNSDGQDCFLRLASLSSIQHASNFAAQNTLTRITTVAGETFYCRERLEEVIAGITDSKVVLS